MKRLPSAVLAALPPGRGVNLDALPPPVTESDFQARVIELARRYGWRMIHHPDSRRATDEGWVDLVLGHEQRGEVWFVELKTDTGRVRKDQRWWHAVLKLAGCRVAVWRPSMWAEIEAVLSGKPTPAIVCQRAKLGL